MAVSARLCHAAFVASGLLVAVAVRVLVGGLVRFIELRAGLTGWRVPVGAVLSAMLAGTVAADFSVPGAGEWWSVHPNAAASATGLLLLAVTVLVVEAVLERVLRASEARRWRTAAAEAVGAVLDAAAGDKGTEFSRLRPPGQWISGPPDPSEAEDLRANLREAHERLRRGVLDVAPVLTATDELHELYDLAVGAAAAIAELRAALSAWLETHETLSEEIRSVDRFDEEDFAQRFPELRDKWTHVKVEWNKLVSHLEALEREAERDLGVEPRPRAGWHDAALDA